MAQEEQIPRLTKRESVVYTPLHSFSVYVRVQPRKLVSESTVLDFGAARDIRDDNDESQKDMQVTYLSSQITISDAYQRSLFCPLNAFLPTVSKHL